MILKPQSAASRTMGNIADQTPCTFPQAHSQATLHARPQLIGAKRCAAQAANRLGRRKMSIDAYLPAFSVTNGKRVCTCIATALLLAGCDENGEFNMGEAFAAKPEAEAAESGSSGEFIEKEVEAPEVFSADETGLWDGRPSLGGIWVAHPDVKEPERVMIRNTTNGKFVVGALFRRERSNPGPRLQLSSDAAAELDILAGSPTELSVVALRKERIEVAPPEPEEPDAPEVAAPAEIEETELDPIAAASAAIDAAEPTPAPAAAAAPAATAAAEPIVQSSLPETTATPASTAAVEKPFIQVGIYSVEKNADAVADQMRSAGMVPTVKTGDNNGSPFWRVVVGPANSVSDQEALLKKIKDEGYSDAYFVTN